MILWKNLLYNSIKVTSYTGLFFTGLQDTMFRGTQLKIAATVCLLAAAGGLALIRTRKRPVSFFHYNGLCVTKKVERFKRKYFF